MALSPLPGSYQALYRAWRPHRFAELVGQEHVARTLRRSVAASRVGHAYLFCGPRGTGKTSAARILAQAVNCAAPADGEPCGTCPTCQQAETGSFLDTIEIDAASHRTVDEMQEVLDKVGYAPGAGRFKVYIMDEVHMLSEHAWNAFLKTLEEPPAHTVFVLATTDPRKVPVTVLSRCQRFDFHRLTGEQIAGRLADVCQGEGVAVAPQTLAAIASRAEGGLRDALSLLDQGLAYAGAALSPGDVAAIVGAPPDDAVQRLLTAAADREASTILAEIEALYLDGRDLGLVAHDVGTGARVRLGEALASAPEAVDLWLRGAELLAEAESAMRRTDQPRLLLEIALLRWIRDTMPAAGASFPDAVRSGTVGETHRGGRTGAGARPPSRGAPAQAAVPPSVGDSPATAQAPAPLDAGLPSATELQHDDAGAAAGGGAPGAAAVGDPAAGGPAAGGPPAVGAPGPTGGRPAAGAPLPSVAPLTIEAVRSGWPRVLAQLKRSERSVRVVFADARPLTVEGGKLTLGLPPGYHLVAASKRTVIERVLEATFGVCPPIDFVAVGAPASSGTPGADGPRRHPVGGAPSGSDRSAAPDGDDSRAAGDGGARAEADSADMLHVALDVFQGEVVEVPPIFETGGDDPGFR